MTLLDCDVPAVSDFPQATATDALQWCVVRTRHQHERAVAEHLDALGLAHYLPLERRNQIRGRRTLEVTRPLFPAYLFAAYPDERARRAIRMIDDVADLHVETGRRQERLVQQIDALRRTLEAHPDAEVTEQFTPGRWVRVERGPMMGVTGVLVRRIRDARPRGRVVTRDVLQVVVEFFGRGVDLEVDAANCKPL